MLTTKWLPDTPWAFFPSVLLEEWLRRRLVSLLAVLSFKTRGDYLAIITLAFLMIVKSAFENIPYVGGPRGLLGIDKYTTLVWALFWVVVTLWVIRNLDLLEVWTRRGCHSRGRNRCECDGCRTREAKILASCRLVLFRRGGGGALRPPDSVYQPVFLSTSSSRPRSL